MLVGVIIFYTHVSNLNQGGPAELSLPFPLNDKKKLLSFVVGGSRRTFMNIGFTIRFPRFFFPFTFSLIQVKPDMRCGKEEKPRQTIFDGSF